MSKEYIKNQPVVIGSKKGAGGGAKEADDTLFARHQAAVLDLVSEGEIVGLVDGDASIFFNETRLVDKNTGNTNFKGVNTVQRFGTQDQTLPEAFLADFSTSSITQDFSGNGKLELNTPQYLKITTGSIERALTDYLKVTIFTDAMYKIDKEGDGQGDTLATKVDFDIDFIYYNSSGINVEPMFKTGFQGKCGSKYAHTFGIDTEQFQPFTDWEVKVTRVGGEVSSSSYKVFNNIYCGILESQITDKLEYPLSAYIGVSLDAEQFGTSIPTRSYDLKGVKVKVPTNYIPPDAVAKEVTLASATQFTVGESVTSKVTLATLTSNASVDDGYRASGTFSSAHGIPVGETFSVVIEGATVSSGDNDYNGTFTATSTGVTSFKYQMADIPADKSPGGTKTAKLGSGTIASKSSNTITVRDISGRFLLNSTIYDTNNWSGNTSTISGVADASIKTSSYRRNVSSGATETTDQVWDGNFYTSWTDNPAWIYYDLLTNKRYGLGNYIEEADIDKWELYQIGRYCDEQVPDPLDSTGVSTEPRFSCNLYLTKATEAYKVLQDMASIFRGMQYWMNGQIVAVQDREKDPVYQFSDANVIDGMFEYEGTARKTRHNIAKVTYNNPNNHYKQSIEYVQDNSLLVDNNEFPKVKNIAAFGCTSRGQALRLGKWALTSEKLNTETIRFKTGLNASFLRPGDVINVLDARRQGVGWSGRVLKPSDSTNLVTNGNFGSGITGWTQGAATVSHDSTNNRIKLTAGGAQARAYQSLGTLTANKTYRVKARAYSSGNVDNEGGEIQITTDTGGTNNLDETGTYFTTKNDSFIDFTVTVGGSNATHYIQLETRNLESGEFISFDSIEVYRINSKTSIRIDREIDIVSGQNYKLTLTKPGYMAKLAQDSATIGGTSYSRGDLLTGTSYDTQEESQQVRDDSNNLVFVDWTPYVHSETKTVSNGASTGVTQLGVSDAFEKAPDDETIWILKRTTAANELNPQQYTIASVSESDETTFDIVGIKYNASKFDFVDKHEPLETQRTINMPDGDHEIPPPTNLIVVAGGTAGPANTVNDTLTISWSPPKVDSSGVYDSDTAANNVIQYPFTKGYVVEYKTDADPDDEFTNVGMITANTFSLADPRQGTYTFKIRTMNMLNMVSEPLTAELTITPKNTTTKSETQLASVNSGGQIDTSITLTSSNVTFGSTSPEVTNTVGKLKTASNPGTLAFASLANSGVGYVYWDYSAATITAKVKNADNGTWYNLGGSEFASATGTVSCTAGSEDHVITGSSTTFTSDFSVGSKIRVNDTDAETYTVLKIDSDTSLTVTEPIAVTRSGSSIKKESFVADPINDTILATITENSSGNAWTIVTHAVERGIPGADGQDGTDGTDGSDGDDGANGLRTANGYLYYNTQQASAPSAPSNSSVTYNFSTGLMSGGVIGTGSTNWNQAAPAAEGGSSGSKMYYVYWAVTESSAGSGSGTPTFGSTVYTATNFVGLVKFSGTNTLVDGSGTSTTALVAGDLGSSGTTTIDGGRITTGTISSSNLSGTSDGSDFSSAGMRITMSNGAISSKNFRIASDGTAEFKGTLKVGTTSLTETNTLNANTTADNVGLGNVPNVNTLTGGDKTGGEVGGWTIDSSAIYSGTKDTSGYTASNGHITLSSSGSIHTPAFYVNSNGTAGFKGTVTIGTTDLNETNTLNENTTADNVGLGNVDNDSTATIRAVAAATSGTTGGWTISSTKISSTNIELNSTNRYILISDD